MNIQIGQKMQQAANDDTTIFGTDFPEPGMQKKHLVTRENCMIVLLAVLVLVAFLFIFVFSLHLF